MPVKNRSATSMRVRESPRDLRVMRWLKRRPVPAVVVGDTAEGDEVRVKIAGQGAKPAWADAARALHECDRLVALDADGDTVRTLEHDHDDPELRAETQREESLTSSAAAPLGVGSPLLAIDVPRLVEKIAESMASVARSSAEQQSQAHSEAFKQMGAVLTSAMSLITRLERQLEDLASSAPEPEPEPEPSSDRDAMAMQVLGQVLGGRGNGQVDLASVLRQIPPEKLQEIGALLGGSNGSE